MTDWAQLQRGAEERYRDGEARLPDDLDARQRQLTRMGNAAGAAGLSLLMAGDTETARLWFGRAADRYRESYADAPPGSWGRPIGAMKARILAGDWDAAARDAEWALSEGAAEAESPIGRYAAALALLTLGRWEEARVIADGLRTHDGFPTDVADALAYIAGEDPVGYTEAIDGVLESFEKRDAYLEDIPVADTVIVLEALAARRGFAEGDLQSALLPRRA
jgi:hypothetical protein